jgi:protein SCO1/2
MPAPLQGVDFKPELNAQMPLDLPFRDETGRAVKLGDYFGQKPVVLAFVYFSCPMLCDQVQQGVVGSLRMLSFSPGRDYEVVFISFDARDTSEKAAQKKPRTSRTSTARKRPPAGTS